MPLYLTASQSSKFSKTENNLGSRRISSSLTQSKPVAKRKNGQDENDSLVDDRGDDNLDATGKIVSVVSISTVTDVVSAIQHITSTMFCPIPERAGMNSVRISQTLNFQKNLPPLVTLAHVHALVSASSKTERQISALLSAGRIRKISISGRGNDISGYSDVLITMVDLHSLLQRSDLTPATIKDFIQVLQKNPRASTLESNLLSPSQIASLSQAGFLVSSSLSGSRNLSLSGASHVAIPSISRAASGSSDAVGGEAAFEKLGGVGSAQRSRSSSSIPKQGDSLSISIPNIGPYLRLLQAGRQHLTDLLKKCTYRETPLYLLRERWDGNVDHESDRVGAAKRARGEFGPVVPAKTKKWKDLYGLTFDWALEECLGAGMVELFETRSVGLGVRALS